MTELNELYQETILDHNKRPRNLGKPEGANRTAEGFNPLCGDHITLYLRVLEGVIQDVGFEGSGCAVSKASASMMTEMLKGNIESVLKTLTYREREIIKLRYGLGDGYTYTLEEVGRIFKVTRERVRQIEAKAVRKLQHPARSKQLKGFLDRIASITRTN